MKQSARLYYCSLCRKQVIICSDCDRGNLYCEEGCATKARIQTCREAERRYQQSLKGRLKHAARQARYRAKIKKVTDQGSKNYPQNGVLNTVKNDAKLDDIGQYCCCFCHRAVQPQFRLSFLYQMNRPMSTFLRPP